ncbi:cationic peroxidase 1-like isoform X2 [Cynara cardunculus var. scolymus]|uniref:cationic peroxidase 1-like isoform X2 n=1 Tax=Cynara cardunculus var. scolymus TaxID=59895 RepID=UPI000D62A466|nr:cationic peroxidase 1-like isoform X2 [Cynara cardunculus var. scolymus]
MLMALSSFSSLFKLSAFTLCLSILVESSSGQLSTSFYSTTCPNFRSVITRAVNAAVSKEARMGASLLRLHFHDCFVNLGGPSWNVLFGRRDSTKANLNAANSNLPSPDSSLSALISTFSNKGFTVNEMVALSGAHTIGQVRCSVFRKRLYNDNNINSSFATSLRAHCPSSGGDDNLSPLDASPASFDNRYFNNLINQRGLLHSDQELFNGGSTDAQVRIYASNRATFSRDFANAMVKMGKISPLIGSNGQVRTNCRRTN